MSPKHTSSSYHKAVEGLITPLFLQPVQDNPDFHAHLVKTIIEAFHLPQAPLNKEANAILILDNLFSQFTNGSFSFIQFIETHLKKKVEIKHFLTAILYGLYYGDISLPKIRKELFEFLLLQILAETASHKTLKTVLDILTQRKQLQLICYAFQNYREGSFSILAYLEKIKSLSQIIFWLRRNYYDINKLENSLEEHTNLPFIIEELEKHALRETTTLYTLFHAIIPLMISSPLRIYEAIGILGSEQNALATDAVGKEKSELQSDSLRRSFKTFYTTSFSLQDFLDFTRLFGLRGHIPFLEVFGTKYKVESLVEKFLLMQELFNLPLALTSINKIELLTLHSFVLTFLLHLETRKLMPHKYREGLDLLSFSIPTKGRLLAEQSGLITLLNSLKSFVDYNNIHFAVPTPLKNYPIFVFDQSDSPLFSRNSKYITHLNHHCKSAIIHLSQNETLKLAQKIGIEPLVDTTKTGVMGYAGVRNCQFLLTPVLKHAYRMGYSNSDALLKMDDAILKELFQTHVLGTSNAGDTILMLDDDMEFPEANMYSHALFAWESQKDFQYSCGIGTGRFSKVMLKFQSINKLLETPPNDFPFFPWSTNPLHALLSEYVGKPKICLNIPNAGEEANLNIVHYENFLLQQSKHLGGTRFPTNDLPTYPFIGLDKHLKIFAPYLLKIQTNTLIDSLNKGERCALPWNDDELLGTFSNLRNVFDFIVKDENKKELQLRFWANIDELYHSTDAFSFRDEMQELIQMDIDGMVREFASHHPLDKAERQSLENLAGLYKFLQQDAKYFWEFGLEVLTKIQRESESFEQCTEINLSNLVEKVKRHIEKKYGMNFEDYPLTKSFYLLKRALGVGEFCDVINLSFGFFRP